MINEITPARHAEIMKSELREYGEVLFCSTQQSVVCIEVVDTSEIGRAYMISLHETVWDEIMSNSFGQYHTKLPTRAFQITDAVNAERASFDLAMRLLHDPKSSI